MKTSIRNLRAKTKQILSAVQRGETVIISNRGVDYAKIVAADKPQKNQVKEPDMAFGMWADHKDVKDVKAYIDRVRAPRHAR